MRLTNKIIKESQNSVMLQLTSSIDMFGMTTIGTIGSCGVLTFCYQLWQDHLAMNTNIINMR